jgi:hypothetical protein
MGTYGQDINAFSKPRASSRNPRTSGDRLFSPPTSAARNPDTTETIEARTIKGKCHNSRNKLKSLRLGLRRLTCCWNIRRGQNSWDFVICLFALIFSATQFENNETLQTFPVTYIVIELIRGTLDLFLIVIIVYFSGALVWKDRDDPDARNHRRNTDSGVGVLCLAADHAHRHGDVENLGALVTGANYLAPVIGYNYWSELTDSAERKKYGLTELDLMPPPKRNCIDDCFDTYIPVHSDWVDISAIISTRPDQIAIAPGSLVREWQQDNRRYFEYKLDHPSMNLYFFASARYEVARETWNGINLEVYYLKEHP